MFFGKMRLFYPTGKNHSIIFRILFQQALRNMKTDRAKGFSKWLSHLSSNPVGAATALVLVIALLLPDAGAQEHQGLRNHFLGIGNCPPWHPQAVEVCKHSLEKVAAALAPRIDAGPDQLHILINEGASAAALKRKATELANQLNDLDRLIIYANLPLGPAETADGTLLPGHVLELWADQKPATANDAIGNGIWISAPAFAAMVHTIPAAEVVLLLDTNNSQAVSMELLDGHAVDLKERPEALVSSSGAGQAANYSADRTISLFAKHLALSLRETEGTLQDVLSVATGGTRQAAIPICTALLEQLGQGDQPQANCEQVPEIHDPDGVLLRTVLVPPGDTKLN